MTPWKLSDTDLKEIKENSFEVALLPMGATEPHSLLLPYGTDCYQTEAAADRAGEKARRPECRAN